MYERIWYLRYIFIIKKVKAATSSITKNVFKCMGVWGGEREKY